MSQDSLRSPDIRRIVLAIAERIEANHKELSALDAAIGDGDHGVSMSLAFREARLRLESLGEATIGETLRAVGTAFLSKVGGATGAVFGTMFLRAAREVADRDEVTLTDLARMAQAAEEGVRHVGKAEVGDKTVLDALHPVVVALEKCVQESWGLKAAVRHAAQAARSGAEATASLIAKAGRASRLGQRSAGHVDPGSVSLSLMLEAAADALDLARDPEPQSQAPERGMGEPMPQVAEK